MFNFVTQTFKKLATYIQRPFKAEQEFDFETWYAQGITQAEDFINNYPDLIEAPITTLIRQQWNWIAFGLGEHHRERSNLNQAVHFYKKVSQDSYHAKDAYFHLGNIYWNDFKNYREAAYYFDLGEKKGDKDASLLKQVCLQHVSAVELKNRKKYYAKLNINTSNQNIPTFDLSRVLLKRGYINQERNVMLNATQERGNGKEEEKDLGAGTNPGMENPERAPAREINLPRLLPKHLEEFHKTCDVPYSTDVSDFHKKVKMFVTRYKARLEKDKPWLFKEIWETRMQDVKELEAELNGVSATHYNDERLILLCQKIANQPTQGAFFGRNELPVWLKQTLAKAGTGRITVHLVGKQSYGELQTKFVTTHQELLKAQKTIIQLEGEKKNTESYIERLMREYEERMAAKDREWKEEKAARDKKFAEEIAAKDREHQATIAEMIKKSDEAKAAKDREHQATITEMRISMEKEFSKKIDAMANQIAQLQASIKTLQEDNIRKGMLAVKYQEQANLYNKYVVAKNYNPTLFKSVPDLEVPPHLKCPISKDLMVTPVVAEDGYTYEKEFIEKWLKAHNTSPLTSQEIGKTLIPNRAIEDEVSNWLQKANQLQNNKEENKTSPQTTLTT